LFVKNIIQGFRIPTILRTTARSVTAGKLWESSPLVVSVANPPDITPLVSDQTSEDGTIPAWAIIPL